MDNLFEQMANIRLVNVFELTQKDWLKLAKCIDNNFIGSEKSFTATRYRDFYNLNTNRCDDCSVVRVYYIGNYVTKITRLADDVETWAEIHQDTYKRIEFKFSK